MSPVRIIPSSLLGLLAFAAGLAGQGWARTSSEQEFVFNPSDRSRHLQAGFRMARFDSKGGSMSVRLSERLPTARNGVTKTVCSMRFELLEDLTELNFTHTLMGGQAAFRLVETRGDEDSGRLEPGAIVHWRLEDSLLGLVDSPDRTSSGPNRAGRTVCSWDTAVKAEPEARSWNSLHMVAMDARFRLSLLWVESLAPAAQPRPLSHGSVYLNPLSQISATCHTAVQPALKQ